MSDGKTQVLNLDEELKRHEITYQGNTFQLHSRSELSILELHELSSLLKQNEELSGGDISDGGNAAKIGATLQSIAAMLVVDPPEGGFPEQLCAAILNFWTDTNQPEGDAVPPPKPRRKPQDRKPKNQSTGAK